MLMVAVACFISCVVSSVVTYAIVSHSVAVASVGVVFTEKSGIMLFRRPKRLANLEDKRRTSMIKSFLRNIAVTSLTSRNRRPPFTIQTEEPNEHPCKLRQGAHHKPYFPFHII